MNAHGDITRLLLHLSEGNDTAWDDLMAVVYHELRQLAHQRLRWERKGLTLGTTALVHEAYLKLVNIDRLQWQNRAQFFAIAAQAMRRIVIDYAKTAKRLKRGGGQRPLSLDADDLGPLPDLTEEDADDLLALDDALHKLATLDDRQRQVVELRFFSGLTIAETAEVMGVSLNTVKRDWNTARAWLNRELGGGL